MKRKCASPHGDTTSATRVQTAVAVASSVYLDASDTCTPQAIRLTDVFCPPDTHQLQIFEVESVEGLEVDVFAVDDPCLGGVQDIYLAA
jgi:hypothetical protein